MIKLTPKYYHTFCYKWKYILETEFTEGFAFNKKNREWLKFNATSFDISCATYCILWYHNRERGKLFCKSVDFELVPYNVAYKTLITVIRDKKLLKREITQLAKKYPL